jgi:hypothetical protein
MVTWIPGRAMRGVVKREGPFSPLLLGEVLSVPPRVVMYPEPRCGWLR